MSVLCMQDVEIPNPLEWPSVKDALIYEQGATIIFFIYAFLTQASRRHPYNRHRMFCMGSV
jgi:hypothetical protein